MADESTAGGTAPPASFPIATEDITMHDLLARRADALAAAIAAAPADLHAASVAATDAEITAAPVAV